MVSQKTVVLVQYSSNHGGSTISGLLIARMFVAAGWRVHVVFGFAGRFEAVFQKEGCSTEVVPHSSWLRSGSFWRFLRNGFAEWRKASWFAKVCAEQKADLVYVNSLVSMAAAVGAKRQRVPVIWHLRELFSDAGGEMMIPGLVGKLPIRRMVRRNADQVVCISESVRCNLLGNGDSEKTRVIPNAVDARLRDSIDRKGARSFFDLESGAPVVGIPGTLRPMKGHTFVFQSLAAVLKQIPSVIVVVSGDLEADYASTVLKQAREFGVYDSCRFLGNVEDMSQFYAACDVVCVPSRSEPFGRTVIEAFASNRPVIGSRVGGIRETIRDSVNGVLVDYGDYSSMATAIVRVLSDQSYSNRIVERAKCDLEERYTEEACAKRLLKLVEQVTAS